jgi:hypothetical protein
MIRCVAWENCEDVGRHVIAISEYKTDKEKIAADRFRRHLRKHFHGRVDVQLEQTYDGLPVAVIRKGTWNV